MATHAHTTSRVSRVLVGLAVLWGMIGLSGAGSWAFDNEDTRATLRGVEGVHVLIEYLKPEVERAGLTRQRLQTDVELQLHRAGIPVLTKEERLRIPGAPYLYVSVQVLLKSDGLTTAYNIGITLRQRASLEIDASLATVSTWEIGAIGIVGIARIDTIRNHVRDYVDEFINVYFSVNPRPAGSPAPSSASPRRDLVRQVQERLQTVGFNPGTIDGSMGPQTQQALRWFQNAKGLVANGDLDERTLDALGVR
jgi:hypothetical protein